MGTPAATFVLPTGVEVPGEPVYGRYGNPSRLHLESVLAKLEHSKNCLTFSSGMAAAHAMLQTLRPGDHVVAGNGLYGGVLSQIRQLEELGISFSFVNGVDPAAIGAAVTEKTKLVWLEACTNPTIQVLDISDTVLRVKAGNQAAHILIDNTFLTPWVVCPLDLGVDVVMHSCTKYINGHSDVILGALLCNNQEIFSTLSAIQRYRGATPSPFDCFLVVRSLATLEIRMEKHMTSGVRLAQFLETCEGVENVQHPLLSCHTQHHTALFQHQAKHSGMIAFSLSSGIDAAKFLRSLKIVKSAASLGSTHSLACQPARLTHAMCTQQERDSAGVTDGLVRLSVGLEDVEDIIEDVKQALNLI